MPDPVSFFHTGLTGTSLPAGLLWVVLLILAFLWLAAHGTGIRRSFEKSKPSRAALPLLRVAIGTVALWAFWEAVARFVVLETPWPLWVHGLLGAGVIEAALALYGLEKRSVSKAAGRWLAGLRVMAILAVLTMLAQPVFVWNETRRIDRHVVILMDDSASMHIADRGMPVAERLALAAFLGIEETGKRPAVCELADQGRGFVPRLEAAVERVRDGNEDGGPSPAASLEQVKPDLEKMLGEMEEWTQAVSRVSDENDPAQRGFYQNARDSRSELRRLVADGVRGALAECRRFLNPGEERRLRMSLRETARRLTEALQTGQVYVTAVEEKFYAGLPPEVREKIEAAAARPRRELAGEAMTRKQADGSPGALELLSKKYTVRHMRFGRRAEEAADLGFSPEEKAGAEADFGTLTDLTAALQKVRETHAPESLAGVVVLSDMRHNGALPPDDAARQLGLQGTRICPVPAGSSHGVKDAAVLRLDHPHSIFLGDRLRVKAQLKADGLRGQEMKVQLLRDGKSVNEQTVKISGDALRTELLLTDDPPEKGIFSYQVKIAPLDGELFPENNTWAFDAAVSDDRTNVLLIDDRPRWEFRYLRNLFDSRDKSVHLQYVLLNPDTVAGAAPVPVIPASAGRPFGESEATRLPVSAEEWRKFDVIILGDVSPSSLDAEVWRTLRDCVGSRGAMLVLVAGAEFMPHAFGNPGARELIPVKYDPTTQNSLTPPEPFYRLMLTAEGKGSPVFSQSLGGAENARIWEQMPLMTWRFAHQGAKEGARVLAWAHPSQDGENAGAAPLFAVNDGDLAEALQRQRALEQRNALVTVSQVELGKVALLAFDQTWRFRYGAGDTFHHRFWGQLIRWGAGENLPSGHERVRLGTDKLTYEPGESVKVSARLKDEASRPLTGADVTVKVTQNGQTVARRKLDYRPDSQGMYEGKLEGLPGTGAFQLELEGPEITRLTAAAGPVTHRFRMEPGGNPVELGDLTVDLETAARVASLSGGSVIAMKDAAQLVEQFGPGSREVEERREISLWDHWMLLALAAGALTVEWILRRRVSLA